MSFQTGTASSYADLYTKLIAFLTGAAMGDQKWRKVWSAPGGDMDGVVLSGPGLAGLDNVYVGLDLVGEKPVDQVAGRCWMRLFGMTGYIASAQNPLQHVNVNPHIIRVFLDQGPMTYWFIGNGRRFMVVVKISTVFQSAYAGFFLPYATPIQYPYPLFIGGTAGRRTLSDTDSWRSVQDGHAAFTKSWTERADVNDTLCSISNCFLTPDGQWQSLRGVNNGQAMDGALHPNGWVSKLFGYTPIAGQSPTVAEQYSFTPSEVYGWTTNYYRIADLPMVPFHILQNTPNDAVLGVLDGCFKVPGTNNASENIITVDGENFLTVQNAFRTGVDQYHAVLLG